MSEQACISERVRELLQRHDLKRTNPGASPWHGLLLGNGDMGAVVFGPEYGLRFRMNKLDLWDSRWPEEEEEVEVHPLSRFKEIAARESARLAEGERIEVFDRLPWTGATVPYPCLRTGADLVFSASPPVGTQSVPLRLRLEDATLEAGWSMSFWGELTAGLEAFICRNRNVLALRLSFDERFRDMLALALERDPRGGRDEFNLRHGEWGLRDWVDPDSGRLQNPTYALDAQVATLTQTIPGDKYCRPFAWTAALCCEGEVPFQPDAQGRPWLDLRGTDLPKDTLHLYLALATSREAEDQRAAATALALEAAEMGWEALHAEHTRAWQEYWSAHLVDLEDAGLEREWYRSAYALACQVRPEGPAPGLFGVAIPYDAPPWRGDRHNNWPEYACTFWGCFVSNHTDLVRNYLRHINGFLPQARRLSAEIYECEGVAFPHLYIDYTDRVYFDNLWGRSLYLTAITAQSFWWYYLYTQDQDFLVEQGYPVLREACEFYVSLVQKNPPGNYDLWPTVPPEYRGFLKDLKLSRNCLIDLAMVRFLLRATLEAAELLEADADRRGVWRDLLENLPPYPTLEHKGRIIFNDVSDNPEIPPYNHPIGVTPLFPGEDPECFGSGRWREVAEATLRSRRWGDFEQVAYARLGDTEQAYRLAGGEAEPAPGEDSGISYATGVKQLQNLGELLLQSWDGVIRVFPAWPRHLRASFTDLRAVGAFLISADCAEGEIGPVRLRSEAGALCRVAAPWPGACVRQEDTGKAVEVETREGVLHFATEAGASYVIERG